MIIYAMHAYHNQKEVNYSRRGSWIVASWKIIEAIYRRGQLMC